MEIKFKMFSAVAPHLGGDAILSSNMSGLSLTEMAERLPENLRPRFLGTHFFHGGAQIAVLIGPWVSRIEAMDTQ
jgi:3-hydroxyacyl-CoA dehydrogenase